LLEFWPILLHQITPVFREGATPAWWLAALDGSALPLDPAFQQGWLLHALAGGAPCSLFGLWDGYSLLPLTVTTAGQMFIANSIGVAVIGDRGGCWAWPDGSPIWPTGCGRNGCSKASVTATDSAPNKAVIEQAGQNAPQSMQARRQVQLDAMHQRHQTQLAHMPTGPARFAPNQVS
jgi:hypothetical protein